jgi:uncharacterized coiled-coil protein SlyX
MINLRRWIAAALMAALVTVDAPAQGAARTAPPPQDQEMRAVLERLRDRLRLMEERLDKLAPPSGHTPAPVARPRTQVPPATTPQRAPVARTPAPLTSSQPQRRAPAGQPPMAGLPAPAPQRVGRQAPSPAQDQQKQALEHANQRLTEVNRRLDEMRRRLEEMQDRLQAHGAHGQQHAAPRQAEPQPRARKENREQRAERPDRVRFRHLQPSRVIIIDRGHGAPMWHERRSDREPHEAPPEAGQRLRRPTPAGRPPQAGQRKPAKDHDEDDEHEEGASKAAPKKVDVKKLRIEV